GPGGISAGLLADDLQHLLDRAAIRSPYILVPASIGGLTVELFARRHPERVAGLVFVDAADRQMLERVIAIVGDVGTEVDRVCLVRIAARLGILRPLVPPGPRKPPPRPGGGTTAVLC